MVRTEEAGPRNAGLLDLERYFFRAIPVGRAAKREAGVRVIRLDPEAIDAFLADLRLGVLSMLQRSGAPAAVPLWYGWNGVRIEMFSERRAVKVRRLERDPRASLLITNIPPEAARWVALEGYVEVRPEHGQETAERLTRRYLVHAPESEKVQELALFRRLDLVQLVLEPERIRSYAEVA